MTFARLARTITGESAMVIGEKRNVNIARI
jgi:hypothetical protein